MCNHCGGDIREEAIGNICVSCGRFEHCCSCPEKGPHKESVDEFLQRGGQVTRLESPTMEDIGYSVLRSSGRSVPRVKPIKGAKVNW